MTTPSTGVMNGYLSGLNANFSTVGNASSTTGLISNGQMWIGTTALNAANTHINIGTITSPLGTLNIGYSSPNITIDVASGGGVMETLSDDVGTLVTPSGNNIQLVGHVNNQTSKFSTTVAGVHLMNINPMSSARWIVDKLGFNGTHTTIASALTSATSGDTIFLMPGTYSENPTLKAGVNLTAWGTDSSLNDAGTVIINGNCTLSTAGTVSIFGIQLQTNSGNFLTVSGSAASIVNLNNCYLNCSNNTGISYSSSGTSSEINVFNCNGNLGTTGIALYTATSAGSMNFENCTITNSGASTTASSTSACTVSMDFCIIDIALSTSSTGVYGIANSSLQTNAINTAALTTAGTGSSVLSNNYIASGTASAISIGAGTTVQLNSCTVNTSNTNAITGAGSIKYSGLNFPGTSALINTTTQTGGTLPGGQNQAPSAGFLGEQIRATVASGSAVSVSNNSATNVTNISLTAGIWDVSCMCNITCTGTFTTQEGSINTNSATRGTDGDNANIFAPTAGASTYVTSLVVPAYRLTLTSTTTVYMVAYTLFSSGAASSYGRISATRVG